MKVITTFAEFRTAPTLRHRIRAALRDMIIRVSIKNSFEQNTGWVSFPYYHHVFDDEIEGFEHQIKFMKNYGDFISVDDAVTFMNSGKGFSEHYFCLTFDDGFECLYHNMLPVSVAHNIPVMIYLPTDYIGLNVACAADRAKISSFYPEAPKLVPFLSWAQCREMLRSGISFGSHTLNHANLSKLVPEQIEHQLRQSKLKIEGELNASCRHFACPWGQSEIDFDPRVAPMIARDIGYESFATTNRGRNDEASDPFLIRRDHTLAAASEAELRYFLWV